MKFSNLIENIEIIGFDLDDTLWNNHPVINEAVDEQFLFLSKYLPNFSLEHLKHKFQIIVQQLISKNPIECEDMTNLRMSALSEFCNQFELESPVAKQAFEAFYVKRQAVTLYPQTKPLLSLLKKHFTVVAISNGNVDLHQIGIAHLFDLHWQAGRDGRAKPHPEMLLRLKDVFNVTMDNVLYVGDSYKNDLGAAKAAGCYSVVIPSAVEQHDVSYERLITFDDLQQFYDECKRQLA